MLNHHSSRLARRFSTLAVLVAALAALSYSPGERKALATTPNGQAASSANTSYECVRGFNPDTGDCAIICCDETSCSITPCH